MHLDVGHPTQRQIDKLNDIFLGYSLDSRGFHVTTMLASMTWLDLMGTCLHRLLAPEGQVGGHGTQPKIQYCQYVDFRSSRAGFCMILLCMILPDICVAAKCWWSPLPQTQNAGTPSGYQVICKPSGMCNCCIISLGTWFFGSICQKKCRNLGVVVRINVLHAATELRDI